MLFYELQEEKSGAEFMSLAKCQPQIDMRFRYSKNVLKTYSMEGFVTIFSCRFKKNVYLCIIIFQNM